MKATNATAVSSAVKLRTRIADVPSALEPALAPTEL
jgi:hypothetical protein